MRRTLLSVTTLALSAALLFPAQAQTDDDPVLRALELELDRAMAELGKLEPAPYYLAMELTEAHTWGVRGEDGALHDPNASVSRWLDVDLRIGSPELDSSHALRKSRAMSGSGGRELPVTGDVDVLRIYIWQEIDEAYRLARDRWALVESEKQVLVEEEPAPDLAQNPPETELQDLTLPEVDLAVWKATVRKASARLAESEVLSEGSVGWAGAVEHRWFVDSYGARIRHQEPRFRLSVNGQTRAEDGTSLSLYRSWDSAHPMDGFPPAETVDEEAAGFAALLADLRAAPLEEPYNGPVILSDRAAGVFFHEIFGHRIEGHRLKRVDNAQTFRNMVEQKILPEFLSVYDDPTTERILDTDLRGHYDFDNQGVRAERVTIVDKGILKDFLHSRSPITPDGLSNGHGRRMRGREAVSRQGNLIVEAHESISNEELKDRLRDLAKAKGLEYGLMVDEIQGGFTFTGRAMPNAFNVTVLRAYRIYVDGRPDELVRGLNLIGTPLEAFGKIVAAGEAHEVFNGSCGAESGWVPVSAVAPWLLVESAETQRKPKGQDTPPILPPPVKKPAEREARR